MRLACGNVYAEVEGTDAEHAFLHEYLSVKRKGAEHTDAFQRGFWDGKDHLYHQKDPRFPSGLVRPVLAAAKKAGLEVAVADTRTRPRATWDESRLGWARPYQLEAMRTLTGVRPRGIIDMPTGSGKTSVFIGWALGYAELRWLVLVDTKDLLNQAAERFERYSGGERAGRFGDGQRTIARFTVATLQSVWSGLKDKDPDVLRLLEGAQGFVVDEVHVLPAETYFQVAMACTNAYYRAGTTATALMRGDQKDFLAVGVTGPVIHKIEPRTLIDAGVLARGRIVFVEHSCPKVTGTFEEVYEALVMLDDSRNELIVEMAAAAPLPCLTFVRRESHGHALERAIGRAGMRAEFVWGQTSTAARRAACERLQRRNIDVLVTSKIFNKGVDLPLIGGGINAAAGASGIDALQRLGRFMRVSGEKTTFTYYDVLDRGDRWLRRHATERMNAYKAEGYEVEIIQRADLVARARAA